jgi:hypothetical protein
MSWFLQSQIQTKTLLRGESVRAPCWIFVHSHPTLYEGNINAIKDPNLLKKSHFAIENDVKREIVREFLPVEPWMLMENRDIFCPSSSGVADYFLAIYVIPAAYSAGE